MRLHIVSGPVNSGKSSAAKKIVARWQGEGLRVGGIIAEARYNAAREKIAYFARDIRSGRRRLLVAAPGARIGGGILRVPAVPRSPKRRIGSFVIFPTGFRFSYRAIKRARACDAICLDEIGPLELRGAGTGHDRALRWLLRRYSGIVLLVVRESILENVANRHKLRLDAATLYQTTCPTPLRQKRIRHSRL